MLYGGKIRSRQEWKKRLFRSPSVIIKARNNKAAKEVRGPSDGKKATVWGATFLKKSQNLMND